MESIADRTAVLRMPPPPEGEYYKRADVVEIICGTVGRSGVSAVGQLEAVGSWEVVFHSQSLKCRFLEAMQGMNVNGKALTTYPMKSLLRWVRITRIPLCVPHELLVAEIAKFGGKVIHTEYEIDPNDELMTNVRSYKVEIQDADLLPDRIEWKFDGMKGTGLLFVRGRKPRCDACGSREHLSKDCSTPYCRRCRQPGHFQSDFCGRRSYLSATTGATRDRQQQPTGSAAAPPTAATPTPPPTAEPEAAGTASSAQPTDAEPTPQPTAEPAATASSAQPTDAEPTPQPASEPETTALQPPMPAEPFSTGPWLQQVEEVDMADAQASASESLQQTSSTKERARPRESASEAGSDAEEQSNDRMETEYREPSKKKRHPKKSKTTEADAAKPPSPKTSTNSTPQRRRTIPVFDPTAGRTAYRTPVTAAARRPN